MIETVKNFIVLHKIRGLRLNPPKSPENKG